MNLMIKNSLHQFIIKFTTILTKANEYNYSWRRGGWYPLGKDVK